MDGCTGFLGSVPRVVKGLNMELWYYSQMFSGCFQKEINDEEKYPEWVIYHQKTGAIIYCSPCFLIENVDSEFYHRHKKNVSRIFVFQKRF